MKQALSLRADAPNITEHALAQFSGGSTNLYRHWTRALYHTDGVNYLAENGAGWLVDAIASHQGRKELTRGNPMLRDFQLWTLKRLGSGAVLTCRADSDYEPAITQEIEFTDFPLESIKLYVELGAPEGRPAFVLMLPCER